MKPIVISIIILYMATGASAQHRVIGFNKGDELKRRIFTASNCILQRGDQVLNITSRSDIQKTYSITGIDSGGFSVNVNVDRIIDTLNTMNGEIAYDTDIPADTSSSIQQSLKYITGKEASVNLSINQNGYISSVARALPGDGNYVVLAFTGVQPEEYIKGADWGITADIPYSAAYQQGLTWTDSVKSNGFKRVSTFKIDAFSASYLTISFTTIINETNFNSTINGVLVMDVNTGLVLNRQMQCISIGYEVVGGTVYSATRRSAVSESCYRNK
ncbi:MAG TPA: hypothetical protein VG738_21795 [Chitinophagaceae bacterium]|nr:hypothetical protein [Chitinophagaceae bacterium]